MDCETCGGVADWGDFGQDENDGSVGATCTCPPPPSYNDLLATIVELRAALAPFAAFANEPSTDARQDDWPLWALNDHEMTMGDVRRAAALLGDEEEGTDGEDRAQ